MLLSDQDYRNRASRGNALAGLIASESVPSRPHLATNRFAPRHPEERRSGQAFLCYHNPSPWTLIPIGQVDDQQLTTSHDKIGAAAANAKSRRTEIWV